MTKKENGPSESETAGCVKENLGSADFGQTKGIVSDLGRLGASSIITEDGVAEMFNRHPASVKRAVKRGELPRPCRLFGKNTWTVGALIRHIEDRLALEAKEAERMAMKIRRLSP